jgi:subtilisin-like proprotein convertase family protein/uncharacterized protein YjlB
MLKLPTNWISRSLVALSALALIGFALPAMAVPSSLSVQGHLSNAAGQPANGNYSLQATLYDSQNLGNALWSDTFSITVSGGVFDIALGSDVVNPLLATTFIDNPQIWLGISVVDGPGVAENGDPELPRRPLTTVGYAFASQHAATAGSAATAQAVSCLGCVDVAALAFDPATEAELNEALAAIQMPSGSCGDGEAVVAIGADGSIICGPAGVAVLPPDGLNEISNDLLSNQFIDNYPSAGDVPIPDFHPPGILDTINVPDAGIAQTFSVSINVSNSDLTKLTVKLFAPDGTEYLLFDKNNPGKDLGATYPDPNPTLSGDLSEWIGKNPQGNWILNVIDLGFDNLDNDGKINSWSINIQTLSTKKVNVTGDLHMNGKQIKALGDPSESADAVNKKYVDDELAAATKPEAFLKSGAVLTQWGTPVCPNGFQKLYDGVLFATHHSHSGSEGALCLMSNESGAVPGPGEGSSAFDLLYSVRIDHKSNTGVPNSNNVRCSKCYTPTKGPCFRVENSNQCPGDWDTTYSGFLFGSHHSHSGPMGRICIDVDNWENSGQGDGGNYHYATTIHSNSGTGGGASYNNQTLVRCAWCCRP